MWFVSFMRVLSRPVFAAALAIMFFAFSFLCAPIASAEDATQVATAPVVRTDSGELRGLLLPSGRAQFLGVPYAEPPVGNLRWREPIPVKPWRGVREARQFAPPCAQTIVGNWNRHYAETGQEDCLYLNIIVPRWPAKEKLPVMVWIHGGGNISSSASTPLFTDGTLVDHGVILVTVDFRLGVFGFLAHPELTRESSHHASGNYGLMDQIEALRWVRENIAQFGGDPANITIFGQSSGGSDVSLLMVSPPAKNLFQRVIAESGSALSFGAPVREAVEQDGQKLAELLHAPAGKDTLKYLRGLSADDILKVLGPDGPGSQLIFGFTVDGWVVPVPPMKAFTRGEEAPVPMMIGTDSREYYTPTSPSELRNKIADAYGDLAPQALRLYGLSQDGQGETDPLYGDVADQWFADTLFRCNAVMQAAWQQAAHHPAYEYQMEHATPGRPPQMAVHGGELPYVFGFYPTSGYMGGAYTDADHKLGQQIEQYWTNFARTGNPNGKGLPNWPEFGSTQAYIRFTQGGDEEVATGLRKPQCDLYREELSFTQ